MIGKFLTRCLLFTLASLAMLIGVNSILGLLNPSFYDMRDAHTVFLGNSHVETSVNPDSLGAGARNFARSAEVAEYAYAKVRLLHRYNPQLDTIFLGVDNMMIYSDGRSHELMHPSFYGTFTPSDYAAILRYGDFDCITHYLSHPFDITKTYEYLLALRHKDWDLRDTRIIGGFIYLNRNKLPEAMEWRAEHKANAGGPGDENALALYFIDRIRDYCRDNGIALYFFVPPQHRLTPYDHSNFRRLRAERYPDIVALDFMDAPMRDECYGDLHHLNHTGAAAFSRYLRDSIFSRPLPSATRLYTDSIL